MKQNSLGLSNTVKGTRKREFLDAMELVVPWAELVALIEPYAPDSGQARSAALCGADTAAHPLHAELKAGTVVDATLIAAPSSTKNEGKARDPEMHQSKKGSQWYFGMKAHIGVGADSGLAHTVRGTSGNVNDVVEANSLLHGQETDAFGDAGYQGVDKRPGLRKALDKDKPLDDLIGQLERTKVRIRAKVEHPFRVLKQQFGYVKVRYRGLKKNTAQIVTLFALSNLWMVRRKLQAMGQVRAQRA